MIQLVKKAIKGDRLARAEMLQKAKVKGLEILNLYFPSKGMTLTDMKEDIETIKEGLGLKKK